MYRSWGQMFWMPVNQSISANCAMGTMSHTATTSFRLSRPSSAHSNANERKPDAFRSRLSDHAALLTFLTLACYEALWSFVHSLPAFRKTSFYPQPRVIRERWWLLHLEQLERRLGMWLLRWISSQTFCCLNFFVVILYVSMHFWSRFSRCVRCSYAFSQNIEDSNVLDNDGRDGVSYVRVACADSSGMKYAWFTRVRCA